MMQRRSATGICLTLNQLVYLHWVFIFFILGPLLEHAFVHAQADLRGRYSNPSVRCRSPSLGTVYVDSRSKGSKCCGESSHPCGTLRLAISRAGAGARILLRPGRHVVNEVRRNAGNTTRPAPLDLGSSISSIQAEDMSAETVVDCQGGPCLRVKCAPPSNCVDANVTLQGFSIQNGESPNGGGCLYVEGAALHIRNMAMSNCSTVSSGGAITVSNSSYVSVDGLQISRCSAGVKGGGINLEAVDRINLHAVVVDRCFCWSPASPDGVTMGGSSIVSVSLTAMTAVAAASAEDGANAQQSIGGGGIAIVKSWSTDLSDVEVSRSSAVRFGGGLYLSQLAQGSMSGVTLNEVAASEAGGGLYLTDSNVTIQRLSATNGRAWKKQGGGIAGVRSRVEGDQVQIHNCSSSGMGGAVAFSDSNVTMQEMAVTQSSSETSLGGGVAVEKGRFEILGPSSIFNSQAVFGGGIAVVQGLLRFQNLTLSNCKAFQGGGGLFAEQATVAIKDSVLSGNDGSERGGCVSLESTTFNASNTQFVACHALSGGALHTDDPRRSGSITRVDRCLFRRNRALDGGGGYFAGGPVFMEASDMLSNTANANGGGVSVGITGMLSLSDTSWVSNEAVLSGGAIFVRHAAVGQDPGGLDILRAIIRRNRAWQGSGGGIAISENASVWVNVSDSLIDSNFAEASRGGGIWSASAPVTILRSNFTSNSASLGGGLSLMAEEAPLDAGPIHGQEPQQDYIVRTLDFILDYPRMSRIISSMFTKNRAQFGGGVVVGEKSAASFKWCVFGGNSAEVSGGGLCFQTMGVGLLEESQFKNNTARESGGAIAVMGGVMLASATECDFSGNLAASGACMSITEGAHVNMSSCNFTESGATAIIVSGQGYANFVECSFRLNSDVRGPGAVHVLENGNVTAWGSVFAENKGGIGGAVTVEDAGNLLLHNCTFEKNSAWRNGGACSFTSTATIFVNSSLFTWNECAGMGGAISVMLNVSGAVQYSRFSNNRAQKRGGALYIGGRNVWDKGGGKDLVLHNLEFVNNSVQAGGGGAIYGGLPRSLGLGAAHDICTNCTAVNNTAKYGSDFASQPSNFQATWGGMRSLQLPSAPQGIPVDGVDPNDASLSAPPSIGVPLNESDPASFRVLFVYGKPISGLSVVLLDDFGNKAHGNDEAVAAITSNVTLLSGNLRAIAQDGVINFGDILVARDPFLPVTNNISSGWRPHITITVFSLLDEYPSMSGNVPLGLCDSGFSLDPLTSRCVVCPPGHYCEQGQPDQPCPDAKSSFTGGARSINDCKSCSVGYGAHGLECRAARITVKPGYWLDTNSISNVPHVYPCKSFHSCTGFEYLANMTARGGGVQCETGFDQSSRLCSQCERGYFESLRRCRKCGKERRNLFPLLAACLVTTCIILNMLSTAFSSIDIALTEAQIFVVIGAFDIHWIGNSWIDEILQILNVTMFSPEIIGPECRLDFGFAKRWMVSMGIPVAGGIFYLILILLNKAYIVIASSRSTDSYFYNFFTWKQKEAASEQYSNFLIGCATNLLDITYITLAIRCLQVFDKQYYGATVLGPDPTMLWRGSVHKPILAGGSILLGVYVVGIPSLFLALLLYARKHRSFDRSPFRQRFGWIYDRFTRKFWWWRLTFIARRVAFAVVLVFLPHHPGGQVTITFIILAGRIIIQYYTTPFENDFIDYLNAGLLLGQISFVIGGVSNTYFNSRILAQVLTCAGLLVLLLFTLFAFLYEAFNKIVKALVISAITKYLENSLALTESLQDSSSKEDGSVRLLDVVAWFRPHVLAVALLGRKGGEMVHLTNLMALRNRYEAHQRGLVVKQEDLFAWARVWPGRQKKAFLYAMVSQLLQGTWGTRDFDRSATDRQREERDREFARGSGRFSQSQDFTEMDDVGCASPLLDGNNRSALQHPQHHRSHRSMQDIVPHEDRQSEILAKSPIARPAALHSGVSGPSSTTDNTELERKFRLFRAQWELANYYGEEINRSHKSLRLVMTGWPLRRVLIWLSTGTERDSRALLGVVEALRSACERDAGGLTFWKTSLFLVKQTLRNFRDCIRSRFGYFSP